MDGTSSSNIVTPAPRGVLFDYGDTLVEEVGVDIPAGNAWLFAQASHRPAGVTLEDVLARARMITTDVASLRERVHLEIAWPTLTRLIHDYFGVRFDQPMSELELGFWKASVQTRAMPGARAALDQLHRAGVSMAVVSNTSFGEHVIRYELARHGLTDHLAFVMVSSAYSVRKPNPLLFEVAASRLGVPANEIWFVGDRLDTDIVGARAAGMRAVWFNRDAQRDPSPDVDVTVSDWEMFVRHVLEAGVAR